MAKAKSKTPTARRRAPGPSAKGAKGSGIDHKQQSALERGGSLAQRNSAESVIGPKADKPDEITSAAPPNVKAQDEPGRASSPSFDEAPVTGKDATGTKEGPKSEEIKAGAGEAGTDKVVDITKLEDLPAGSSVDFKADEVVIHAAIAGGGRRSFHGKTVEQALAAFNDFAENGPQLVEGAAPQVSQQELDQFDKEAAERSKKDLKARGIKAG